MKVSMCSSSALLYEAVKGEGRVKTGELFYSCRETVADTWSEMATAIKQRARVHVAHIRNCPFL